MPQERHAQVASSKRIDSSANYTEAELLAAYSQSLRFVARYERDPHEARDHVQNAIVRLLKDKSPSEQPLAQRLCKIARNIACSHGTTAARRRNKLSKVPESVQSFNPLQNAESNEILNAISLALAKLPSREKKILEMRLSHFGNQQIAKEMLVGIPHVCLIVCRAKKMLISNIEPPSLRKSIRKLLKWKDD